MLDIRTPLREASPMKRSVAIAVLLALIPACSDEDSVFVPSNTGTCVLFVH
jgi:hypothetical protein